MDSLRWFKRIWLVDFEFGQEAGELPEVRCMVAREYRTGRLVRLWLDDSEADCPIETDSESLFVAYLTSAELNCFRVLGWPLPSRVLDLYVEFRRITNGQKPPHGVGLLGALSYFGLPAMGAAEKSRLRELALRGGPYSALERDALLDYCQEDVDSLVKLLPHIARDLDTRKRVAQALFRGRYMSAVSAMECAGATIDVDTLECLRLHWDRMKVRVIREVDRHYGVFVPTRVGRVSADSARGRQILRLAAEWGINPQHLAGAAEEVQRRDNTRERALIVEAARRKTGLTVNRISSWEHSGKDHSSYPGLDVAARELAGEYPELGLGAGYGDMGRDHAAELWELLKRPSSTRQRDFTEVLNEAAELVDPRGGDHSDEIPLKFSSARFADWLIRNGIPWPRLESGKLDLKTDTFRQQAKSYPQVSMLRELLSTLGTLKLFKDLAAGSDGRNRCMLSPFWTKTGRNQPSNSMFLFGPHVWVRSLIAPPPGSAVSYIDWSQQEIAVGAALSRDCRMMEAYASGDFYLSFAKQCGAAPADATKESHGPVRDLYKRTCLGVQYRMGEQALADFLGKPLALARKLLREHKETYSKFWRWSERAVDHAMLVGHVETVFGWPVHVNGDVNPRSIANHPCQGNGAEMMRLAACLIVERGVKLCAPVHDAFLIEAAEGEIDEAVRVTREAMEEASRIVLGGFTVRTDADIVRYPDRYSDPRGAGMWAKVMAVLEEITREDLADVPF